jgi:hypothetical protein
MMATLVGCRFRWTRFVVALVACVTAVAISPAEVYRSPAVLAGGDPEGLANLFNLVNGFGFPVSVRMIYEDGQVWIATFKLRELPKP